MLFLESLPILLPLFLSVVAKVDWIDDCCSLLLKKLMKVAFEMVLLKLFTLAQHKFVLFLSFGAQLLFLF